VGDNTPGSQTTANAGGFSQTFKLDHSLLSTSSAGNWGAPQEPTGGFKFPMSTGSLTFGPLGKTAVDVGKENTAPVFCFDKLSEPSSTAKPAPLFAFIPSSSTANTGFVFGTTVKPSAQPDGGTESNTLTMVTTFEKPISSIAVPVVTFSSQIPIVSRLKMADSNVIPD